MAAKPKSVVENSRMEKGLSILGILKNTPAYVKATSREEVVVKKYRAAVTKGGHHAMQAVCVSTKHKSPTPHKCSVIGLDKDKSNVSGQRRVVVSCDCEFFMFYCEYALSTWGAARIKYSNGEPAVVRNPGNVPLACKHLVKVLRLIRERGD